MKNRETGYYRVSIIGMLMMCHCLLGIASEVGAFSMRYVNVPKLIIRSEPSISAEIVSFLSQGDAVEVLVTSVSDNLNGVVDKWYKIKEPEGYVFGAYLTDKIVYSASSDYNLMTWFNKNPATFGCFLEQQFGFHDPKFNCGFTDYQRESDPCNKEQYKEGPQIPPDLYGKIHTSIKGINLDWAGGRLRLLTLECRGSVCEEVFRKTFHLPGKGSFSDRNMYKIGYHFEDEVTTITIESFESFHVDEVDCAESSTSG